VAKAYVTMLRDLLRGLGVSDVRMEQGSLRCDANLSLRPHGKKEIWIMLWTILVILLVLWLIGLLSNVGGGLIHLLLVVAVVVLIINLVTGRRAV
jgi:hypothetical protein